MYYKENVTKLGLKGILISTNIKSKLRAKNVTKQVCNSFKYVIIHEKFSLVFYLV